jgi:hypothetical protein
MRAWSEPTAGRGASPLGEERIPRGHGRREPAGRGANPLGQERIAGGGRRIRECIGMCAVQDRLYPTVCGVVLFVLRFFGVLFQALNSRNSKVLKRFETTEYLFPSDRGGPV